MNSSTVNFSTLETSPNFTAQSIGPMDIVETCVHLIGFFFGAPANIYIIWLIFTETRNGFATEFFILNHSVCELIICLNNVITVLPIYYSNLFSLPLFLEGLNISGRPLFQCLICVERYLAVVHPVTFLKLKPLRYRVICCAVVWILTLGCCFFSFFIIVSQNSEVRIWALSTQYVFFLIVQLFCLVAVLVALKQSGPGHRRREEENHMKRRAFKVILLTILVTNFTYVPPILTGFSVILAQNNAHIFWIPSVVCFVLGSFVQPAFYLHRAGKLSFSVTLQAYNSDILRATLLSQCCVR